jgi:hypothetical protein
VKHNIKQVPFRILWLVIALGVACCGCRVETDTVFTQSLNARVIPRFDLLELSFKHNGAYRNKFFDAAVAVNFVSPDGQGHRRAGFFFGDDTWMVRFRPNQLGRWSYKYVFQDKQGFVKKGTGAFECTAGKQQGPIHRRRDNPYRWTFAGGKPYFPVGLQDCVYSDGTHLPRFQIDGESRQGPCRDLSMDEYFAIYEQAGFNLFRFSQRNCSYAIFQDLDHYSENESRITDLLLSSARKHGFRIMFGIFGYHGFWYEGSFPGRVIHFLRTKLGAIEEGIQRPDDLEVLRKEKRFIDYSVARWGAYTDFWELLNERNAPEQWTRLMAAHLQSVDPDRKPIGTSWERPALPDIAINTPHWYESENESDSDLRVQQMAEKWKAYGKPVIVGEHGNTGMNWDVKSAQRMRVRLWTALFNEISLIFWNTSWSKSGMYEGHYTPGEAANIYLGPEERGYVRALRKFSSRLGVGLKMKPVRVSAPDQVRAYGLLSETQAAVYLHHFADDNVPMTGLDITLQCPNSTQGELVGEWIDTSTGDVISRLKTRPGVQTLDVPPFSVDLALLIGSGASDS